MMPPRRRLAFSESAVSDLEGIRGWYAEQSASEVGERLVGEVIAAVEQLTAFPESGRVVPEFESPWLRELVHPPFRIVYRVDTDSIRVVRVWRSERLMDTSLDA